MTQQSQLGQGDPFIKPGSNCAPELKGLLVIAMGSGEVALLAHNIPQTI
jgi:hypothetical protein